MNKRLSVKRSTSLKSAQLIAIGFAGVILAGSVLLSLPAASADGRSAAYIDALFTAVTSTCVTGLVTCVTAEQWSLFGQIVILALIQVGGLGVVSVATLAAVLLGSKIGIMGRTVLQKSLGMDSPGGIISFILRILKATLVVELLGAALYSIVFVREFGLARGLWYSIFNSISAFCNAGIDIIGRDSLKAYVAHPLINITTMLLIILAGLGFPVWNDVLCNIRELIKKELHPSRFFQRLSLHSRLVIFSTVFLTVFGAAALMLFEWNNAMNGLSVPGKLLSGFFQSVTLRTAGFYTIEQGLLGNASVMLCIPLMLIGGSPAGCAGGVKTTTVALLLATAVSAVRERNDVEIMGRRISRHNLSTAITVLIMYFLSLLTLTTIFLAVEQNVSFVDAIYETVSAMATVGLSRGITADLSILGKLILIILMFIGRTGPITVALSLKSSSGDTKMIELPEEEVMVG